ncbi:Sodium/potassium/calcium exchanger 6, partial [Stegodyphus mimosarum]
MGYIHYTKHMYCLYGPEGVASVVAMSVAWLLVLFAGLGVTANDFLCPSLFIISKTLKMSQNVAGVTLLAFGNGSPDIFSAIAGINQGKTEMVIGGLIGGGIFVTTVVAGSIFLTQNFGMMKRPFLRDVFFYMVAAGAAFYLFFSRHIYIYHAVGFVILYIIYIIVVVTSRFIHQKHLQYSDKAAEAANVEKGLKIKGSKAADYDNPEAYGVVLTAFFKYCWEEDRRRNTLNHYCYDNEVFAISLPNIPEELPPSYEETEVKSYIANGICSSGCDYFKSEKCEKVPLPEPVNQWRDFAEKVCPVNLQEWSKQSWMERCLDVFKSPVLFVLLITTPVVDYKSPRDNWCRVLNCLHIVTGPVFIILGTGFGFTMIGGVMPLLAIVVIISSVIAGIIYYITTPETVPRFHTVFAYMGFGVAVVWIYCIANEIVVLLQAVGVAFNLSDSILGLTILAWGNCLLDFLSNLAVARKGFPRMGIAACFGAPFLTLLLGVGVPCVIKLIDDERGNGMDLIYSPLTTILFSALAASLISTVIMMVVCRFQTKRLYGAYLICLYLTFLIIAVLKESNVF